MALTAGFCYVLLAVFPDEFDALGLSLAYSLTSVVTALVLSVIYRKQKSLAPSRIWPFLVRCGLCLGFLLLAVYTLNVLPVNPQTKIGQLLWLILRSSAGFGVYLLAARVMQMKEIRSSVDRLRNRKNPIK